MVTRDGSSKEYAYEGSRDNTVHIQYIPTAFREFLWNTVGMYYVPYYPYYSCMHTFWPAIPTSSFIILVIIILLCICTFHSKDDHEMDEIDKLETIPESMLIPQGM